MNMPTIIVHEYPKLHDSRDIHEVDNLLIAIYLNRAFKWKMSECLKSVHYYMIEVIDGFYSVDENQGILSVGRDNYLITSL